MLFHLMNSNDSAEAVRNPPGGIMTLRLFPPVKGLAKIFVMLSLTVDLPAQQPAVAPSSGQWDPRFDVPGANESVYCAAVLDIGSEPALYIGGWFSAVGEAASAGVARWNGTKWESLGKGAAGSGVSGSGAYVRDIVEYRGSIVIAGDFTHVGGVPARNLAAWDGDEWRAIGDLYAAYSPYACGDEGNALYADAGDLYVGGCFTHAGGVAARNIAKWDGSSWQALGAGLVHPVSCIGKSDVGGEARIYAGMRRLYGDGGPTLARWSGSTWDGIEEAPPSLVASLVDLGNGRGLLLSDESGVKRWDGVRMFPLEGENQVVGPCTLILQHGGERTELFAAGTVWNPVSGSLSTGCYWRNGSKWQDMGGPFRRGKGNPLVTMALGVVGGTSQGVWAAGSFDLAGGVRVMNVAGYDGVAWSRLGDGSGFSDDPVLGVGAEIRALEWLELGGERRVYAAGSFDYAGGRPMRGVVRWQDGRWVQVGGDFGDSDFVEALAVYDDGSGPALYAGGKITEVEGKPVGSLVRWDGVTWEEVGGGVSGGGGIPWVHALVVWDDGSGDRLYVAGNFGTAGTTPAIDIAAWDGVAWSGVGGGVTGASNERIETLAAWNDGSGSALYAGGAFSNMGSVQARSIAQWNGQSWSPVGNGVVRSGGFQGQVHALRAVDMPSLGGNVLVVAGSFDRASGVNAPGIASWDGAMFSPMDAGLSSSVSDVEVVTYRGRKTLYAGGTYVQSSGSVPLRGIAQWTGVDWIGLGVGFRFPSGPSVLAASYDDQGVPSLWMGGRFSVAGGISSNAIARWTPPTLRLVSR